MCNVQWNATLNLDGTVTVYATIDNRVESMTLTPGDAPYTSRKKSNDVEEKREDKGAIVQLSQEGLSKTKRKYLTPDGKMVSYARARALKLI